MTAVAAALLLGAGVVAFGLPHGVHGMSAVASAPAASPSLADNGTWKFAAGQGGLMGTAGPVRRFRVAVENNVNIKAADFAAKAEGTLGDRQSWVAGGEFRLQRVPGNAAAEFTIYLATARTSTRMCADGGLETGGYTSCQTPGHVIINLDRWTTSVPDYQKAGIPLDTYRTYLINHETGHQFGHGHELCPGAGQPAPVMQQQTLGLHGCTANPWPYLAGSGSPRYVGPPGEYTND
jgi:hypothetical protein